RQRAVSRTALDHRLGSHRRSVRQRRWITHVRRRHSNRAERAAGAGYGKVEPGVIRTSRFGAAAGIAGCILLLAGGPASNQDRFKNSIGLTMVRVPAGTFRM